MVNKRYSLRFDLCTKFPNKYIIKFYKPNQGNYDPQVNPAPYELCNL